MKRLMYILEAKEKSKNVNTTVTTQDPIEVAAEKNQDVEKTEEPPVEKTPNEPNVPEEEVPQKNPNAAAGTPDPDQNEVQFQNDAEAQEEDLLAKQIRVDQAYRLKYIFANLMALKKMVDNYIHDDFEDLRNTLDKGIELFSKVLIPNIGKYYETLDVIIDDYDEFLKKSLNNFEKILKLVEDKRK